MKAVDLKNSILQLAISGRLVPQNPADEPASVLYDKIQAEKNKLIKEGKIKSPKKNGRINPAETPFEIPDTWMWVKLGDIADFPMGKTPSRNNVEYWGRDYPWVSIADLIDGSLVNYTKEFVSEKANQEVFKKRISPKGSLLMSFKLTIGKISILNIDAFHNEAIISIFPFIDKEKITTNYLFKILPYLTTLTTDTKEAIKGKTLNSTSLYNILIPLPPLAEQKRIVEKIEELEPLISRYGKAAEELARIKTAFPKDLRNSILQQAIEGKPVPQNPADEPASELLARIKQERQQQIKDGKIKPSKLPKSNEPLNPADMPFQIPDTWIWCRLDDIGKIVGGGTPSTDNIKNWDNGTIPWLTPADMKNIKGKYISRGERNITEYALEHSSTQLMPKGSLVYSSRAPIGYIAIAENDLCTNQGFKSIVPYDFEVIPYLYYALIARTQEIISRASGTTFLEISGTEFGKTLVPLPPLNEQRRIVLQIDTLLNLCDNLEQTINQNI